MRRRIGLFCVRTSYVATVGVYGPFALGCASSHSSPSAEPPPPPASGAPALPTNGAAPSPIEPTEPGPEAELTPVRVTASRFLVEGRMNWEGWSAFDGENETAWAVRDAVPGAEYLEACFEHEVSFTRLELTTGFEKHTRQGLDLFVANAHLRDARVVIDGVEVSRFSAGADERRVNVALPLGARGRCIRLVADLVWPGTRWQDLSISETRIFGSGATPNPASTFRWRHPQGSRCEAAFAGHTLEVQCVRDDELLFFCERYLLGVDLMADPDRPEDLVNCGDSDMAQQVLFVVERNGPILAAFETDIIPSGVVRAHRATDRLVVDLHVADTSGETGGAPVRAELRWDRAARRVGATAYFRSVDPME